jgi:uncharacterized protein involved in response to NO
MNAERKLRTRGEEMLALRRARMAAAPPFLRGGFRPFFFMGALWAAAALVLWLCSLAGLFSLPSAFEPLAWHRHEMLFGFVGAVMAGFLLTAIPNWTGRLPIAGSPLAALFGLWLAGRAAMLFSFHIGPIATAAIDVGFYVALALVAGREVIAAKNRNLPIVAIVLLLAVANLLDHLGTAGRLGDDGLGWRLALGLVIVMISLIGGRIIPSFTRNWLTKRGVREGLPGQPGGFDLTTVAATALAFVGWVAAPESGWVGAGLALAALLQTLRLARWSGIRTWRDPLVLILHIGYCWVPVGIGLLGATILGAPIPRSAAIHALTAGAMGTMILAVMTRASLGHSGRELRAGPATMLLYVLVTLGALLRVAAPLVLIDYTLGMEVAAAAWAGAFLLFAAAYAPVLLGPRIDGAL